MASMSCGGPPDLEVLLDSTAALLQFFKKLLQSRERSIHTNLMLR